MRSDTQGLGRPGARGRIPGLRFADYDGRDRRVRGEFPGMRTTMRSVVAFTAAGSITGEIRWRKKTGEIALVWVVEHLQRRGIATALYAEARRRAPALRHSSQLSDDARAWIRSLEAATPSAAAPLTCPLAS